MVSMFASPPPHPVTYARSAAFDVTRGSNYEAVLLDPSRQSYDFSESVTDQHLIRGRWVSYAGGGGGGALHSTHSLAFTGRYEAPGERQVVTIYTDGSRRPVPIVVVRVR